MPRKGRRAAPGSKQVSLGLLRSPFAAQGRSYNDRVSLTNFFATPYVYLKAPLHQACSGTHHSRRQAMTSVFDRDDIQFQVVVNHEEQYSIWPDYKAIPNGWRAVGKSGLKKDCLAYIDEVWTDMRPLSLRQKMAEAATQ